MVFRVKAKTLIKVFKALPYPVSATPLLTSSHTKLHRNASPPTIPRLSKAFHHLVKATVLTVVSKAQCDLAAWTPHWPHLLLIPAHSTPSTLLFLLVLKCPIHTPASGPLHLLHSRPQMSQTGLHVRRYGPLPHFVQVSDSQWGFPKAH